MTITFVGHGYVGLVTATIFADFGNKVYVIGRTPQKINDLNKGILPIYEPGLEEIVKRNIEARRLIFTLDYGPAIPESDVVFIAVGTPSQKNGEADLSSVFKVAEEIGQNLSGYTVIVTKSTVPVGTNKKIKGIIDNKKSENSEFDIASIPEFLREGTAISDTLRPDRIVIGTESQKAESLLIELHKPIDSQLFLTNLETAEMIKYASNSFLATKISFANSIAKLAETCGADGLRVIEGMGLDRRIGKEFLSPGPGYGGSCFPKDVKALIAISKNYGYQFSLLRTVEDVNKEAKKEIVNKVISVLSNDAKKYKIGILGLAFKANTDDMRDAPAIDIIKSLQEKGFVIKAYDPMAVNNAKKFLKDIEYCKNVYDAAKGTDVLLILTEWNEFKEIDLERIKELMKRPVIIDARNIYDPLKARSLGFIYRGVGR